MTRKRRRTLNRLVFHVVALPSSSVLGFNYFINYGFRVSDHRRLVRSERRAFLLSRIKVGRQLLWGCASLTNGFRYGPQSYLCINCWTIRYEKSCTIYGASVREVRNRTMRDTWLLITWPSHKVHSWLTSCNVSARMSM